MSGQHTRPLPGDAAKRGTLAQALRIDHAGEYGARRIYAGQLAVLKDVKAREAVQQMAAQEDAHLAAFNKLLPEHKVRPSVLMPLWHVGGYALGAATAMLGPRAAMACTVAVESVIAEHYTAQLKDSEVQQSGLAPTIAKFRDEEMEHHNTGLAHEAELTPGYEGLSAAIRATCRAAIWLAGRF